MNIIDIWTEVDINQNQKIVIIKADVVHAVHCVRLSRPQLVPTLQEYSLIYRSKSKTQTNIKTKTKTRTREKVGAHFTLLKSTPSSTGLLHHET